MFAWWGTAVVRLRWAVLAAARALVVVGASWGAGVFGALTGGGYADENSEANRAAGRITAELGRQDPDVIALWSSDTATVDDPAFRSAVTAAVARPCGSVPRSRTSPRRRTRRRPRWCRSTGTPRTLPST